MPKCEHMIAGMVQSWDVYKLRLLKYKIQKKQKQQTARPKKIMKEISQIDYSANIKINVTVNNKIKTETDAKCR